MRGQALEVLRIAYTGIRSLPFSLADCASLHTLDFDGLSLLSPPPQILNKGVTIIRQWLNRLREARGGNRLDLSSLGLDQWPLELNRHAAEGHYDALRRLNLLDNILTELPVEICELSGLVELSAGYNRLESVHPRVAALSSLTSIHLPYNHLETLPETFSMLRVSPFPLLDPTVPPRGRSRVVLSSSLRSLAPWLRAG
jgi:Leucine-rich repeat (LRR) protein